jgi:DNA polymerase-4
MIIHVDMDAFYASVEERDRPELRGQPVIVGGTPECRGVVAAANYEVRKFGVHSAMPAAKAKRLCPHAVFLPSRIDYYAQISRQIRDIFHRFTPLVEPLSLDEAFLDATGSESLFGTSVEIGRQIKHEIYDSQQLVASVGVASNKFLAKMASDQEKPDGFVVVDAAEVQLFLDPLPVGRLWGVGRVTGKSFERLGIRTIGELRGMPLEVLQEHFGEHGNHLWELSRGMDQRTVVPDREARSISHETTFSCDIDDVDALRAWAVELTEQVARRLRRHSLCGRTVQLKIRFSDFQTITRSITLPQPTDVTQEIWHAVDGMLSNRLPATPLPIRLLGVGVTGFDHVEQTQQMLFDQQEHVAQHRLDQTADEIRERFGDSTLTRASGMLHQAKHPPQPKPNDEPDR